MDDASRATSPKVAAGPSRARPRDPLEAIGRWLDRDPILRPMGDSRFLEALNTFEGASDQRSQIASMLADWPSRALNRGDTPPRWLSVGCGGGDLDAQVAAEWRYRFGGGSYVGLDPNPVECAHCRRVFASLEPDISAEVFETTLGDFVPDGAGFDLIYAVHTLYYVDDMERSVERCLEWLRPGGEFVVFHAPLGRLNQLSNLFWEARVSRSVPYSDSVRPALARYGSRVRRVRVEAEVDVTLCLEAPTRSGRPTLDFILQLDSSAMPASMVEAICQYLDLIGRRDGGRYLVPHPVDVFVVTKGE